MMSQTKLSKHSIYSNPREPLGVLDRVLWVSLEQIIQECQAKRIIETTEPLGKLYVFREMRSVLRSDHALLERSESRAKRVELRQENPLEKAAQELPDYSKGKF
jgi:hypothetical protein